MSSKIEELCSGKSLLIVDDHEEIILEVENMLFQYFADIQSAYNGAEAVEICSTRRFDIIIADIEMPRMNGLELLGKIRWNHPDVKIIIISGNKNYIDNQENITKQGYEFVEKPIQVASLIKAIEKTFSESVDGNDSVDVIPGTLISEKDRDNIFNSKDPKVSKWVSYYKHLITFRKRHPNRWPRGKEKWNNSNLGAWVIRQRDEYQKHLKGEDSKLTSEQISLLDELNFIWDRSGVIWLEYYQELVQYRKENPNNWPKCVGKEHALGVWCSRQRSAYRASKKNNSDSFSESKIKMLNDIGFEWD